MWFIKFETMIDGDWAYWSNVFGWVAIDDADGYSAGEQRSSRLPMGGIWEWHEMPGARLSTQINPYTDELRDQ